MKSSRCVSRCLVNLSPTWCRHYTPWLALTPRTRQCCTPHATSAVEHQAEQMAKKEERTELDVHEFSNAQVKRVHHRPGGTHGCRQLSSSAKHRQHSGGKMAPIPFPHWSLQVGTPTRIGCMLPMRIWSTLCEFS